MSRQSRSRQIAEIVLLLGWALLLTAQALGASALTFDAEQKVKGTLLGTHLSFLRDPDLSYDVASILSGTHDARFEDSKRDFPGFLAPQGQIWLRITLNNSSRQELSLLLENRYPLLDRMTLFQRDQSGVWDELTLGDTIPYKQRPYDFRFPSFPLRLSPGENVFYIKMQNQGAFIASLFLWDIPSFYSYIKQDTISLSSLYAVMLAMLIYNLLLAFSVRNIESLYYNAYLVCFIALQLCIQGSLFEWLPLAYGEWIMNKGWFFVITLNHFFSTLFGIAFLNMRKHMPLGYRFMKYLALSCGVVLIAIPFLGYHVSGNILTILTVIVSFALIGSGALAAWRGFRPAIYYTLGWTALLSGNTLLAFMYNGLLPMNFLVQWGNLIGGAMEVVLMSLALGSRISYVQEHATATIKALNSSLEQHLRKEELIVAERTATIRSIIDHVKSGFFTVGPQLTIDPGFTRSCKNLLGDRLHDHAFLPDVLDLKGQQRGIFQMMIQQVFADSIPEAVALEQIPRTFRLGGRTLTLEGGLIRDGEGRPKSILFTITDISSLRKKQREATRSAMLINILQNIDAFRTFIHHTLDGLQQLKTQVAMQSTKETDLILHTIKGNCLIFEMREQAKLIHHLEELDHLRPQDIDTLMRSIITFLERHRSILRVAPHADPHEEALHVPRNRFVQLRDLITQLPGTESVLTTYDRWLHSISAPSAHTLLGPIERDIKLLSKRMGKNILLQIEGADTLVESPGEINLVKGLVHLVRNSVIHGIEEQRSGKSPQGRIRLSLQTEGESLVIRCQDDGKGLDRLALEQRIRQKGLVREGEDLGLLSLAALLDRLTSDGFSTQQSSDLYAGRGLGVAAIFQAARDCGGTIEIESVPGQGTEFRITVPRGANSPLQAPPRQAS